MGYPMTYRRVVNRNGLQAGDYGDVPLRHQVGVNTNPGDEHLAAAFPFVVARLDRYERAYAMLLGDLRRLEEDAVDEQAVCAYIASRTGIDADVVAAVLKEFVSW